MNGSDNGIMEYLQTRRASLSNDAMSDNLYELKLQGILDESRKDYGLSKR